MNLCASQKAIPQRRYRYTQRHIRTKDRYTDMDGIYERDYSCSDQKHTAHNLEIDLKLITILIYVNYAQLIERLNTAITRKIFKLNQAKKVSHNVTCHQHLQPQLP